MRRLIWVVWVCLAVWFGAVGAVSGQEVMLMMPHPLYSISGVTLAMGNFSFIAVKAMEKLKFAPDLKAMISEMGGLHYYGAGKKETDIIVYLFHREHFLRWTDAQIENTVDRWQADGSFTYWEDGEQKTSGVTVGAWIGDGYDAWLQAHGYERTGE